MTPELTAKIESVFGAYVVNKREALRAGFELLPRFVTEFLLASARASNTKTTAAEVHERLRPFWVDADRKSEFISRLMRDGTARLVALLDVEPQPKSGRHLGRIAQLDGHELSISEALVERAPELLYGGLWGTCLLAYDRETRDIEVREFTPYQLTRPDMQAFKEKRQSFSLDEWLDLLLASCGYASDVLPTRRLKLIALSRLVPLVQNNVNLVELGPRGTGKSFLLRSVTQRAYLLAGAPATPASLFYDLNRRQLGIVGKKKVVVFDEVSSTAFPDIGLVAMMKDYMESGRIERGGRSFHADGSLLFTGNLDVGADGQPHRRYLHFFEPFPEELRDTALVDRFHGLIPGWELPKIRDEGLAKSVGFLSDYFGEVLCQLRQETNFLETVRSQVQLRSPSTMRDTTAVHRVAAGLLKMVFPDGNIDEGGFWGIVALAVELRQRVHNQLHKMAPAEYAEFSLAPEGMAPLSAPDLLNATALEVHDAQVNQQELVGKVTMLTVSSHGGGDVGFVECALIDGSGFSVTGLHGKVMRQSIQAAYDAVLHLGPRLGLRIDPLKSRRLAVHLVDIAEPKDGPSAGLAIALAIISVATGRPLRRALAITGEVSLQGHVGEVGGIPEKLTAAAAHGRELVLLPAANGDDVQKCGEKVRAQLDLRAVHTLEEAIAAALV